MKTTIAAMQTYAGADRVAKCLEARMLPKRGYLDIYSEENKVIVVSYKQPSFDFMTEANAFIAGYRAASETMENQ